MRKGEVGIKGGGEEDRINYKFDPSIRFQRIFLRHIARGGVTTWASGWMEGAQIDGG